MRWLRSTVLIESSCTQERRRIAASTSLGARAPGPGHEALMRDHVAP